MPLLLASRTPSAHNGISLLDCATVCLHLQASWLFRAGTSRYFTDVPTRAAQSVMRSSWSDAIAEYDSMNINQHDFLNAALVHSAIGVPDQSDADLHAAAQSFVWDWICSGDVEYTTFGRAFLPKSPLLGDTMLAASLAHIYASKASEVRLL
jgi:hypothetical protein